MMQPVYSALLTARQTRGRPGLHKIHTDIITFDSRLLLRSLSVNRRHLRKRPLKQQRHLLFLTFEQSRSQCY